MKESAGAALELEFALCLLVQKMHVSRLTLTFGAFQALLHFLQATKWATCCYMLLGLKKVEVFNLFT